MITFGTKITIDGVSALIREAAEKNYFVCEGKPFPKIDFTKPLEITVSALDSLGLVRIVRIVDDVGLNQSGEIVCDVVEGCSDCIACGDDLHHVARYWIEIEDPVKEERAKVSGAERGSVSNRHQITV